MQLDQNLKDEYALSETEQQATMALYAEMMNATNDGKAISPMNFDKKAYQNSEIYKAKSDIEKQTAEYLKIKKEQEEAREIAKEQEALANRPWYEKALDYGGNIVNELTGVNDAKRAATGVDPITGEELTAGQRVAAGGMAAAEKGLYGLTATNGFSEAITGRDMFGNKISKEQQEASMNAALGMLLPFGAKGFHGKMGIQGAGGDSARRTVISPEIKAKILEGQRKVPKNQLIGGHSPRINNDNEKFAVEVLSTNADGTTNVVFTKQFSDGNISKIKKSTLFPDSWKDEQILRSITAVGDTDAISSRLRDRATWHRASINGVEIDVIKVGRDVTSGYPTGTKNALRPSGF
ncbi:pre-toxin TG domain-containing protein [Bacillus safensis]|nr:pre-toxin TG domain-containing protein [Bacillus safensis]KIL11186.1 hypothetical protein B4107_1800 [Bacillus safensis]MDP4564735.1 pre-toxin TG domain-containing protein [Bacillus safensis]MEC0922110.1 pre-toxin TG domain-containing protein [Bacillus safensis]MEC0994253.1 pre-toxin TG domain-containing protein [Bacillus safensis]MEC0998322.1 pre-toxin TG domain-containing protein [Bacillus safensis]